MKFSLKTVLLLFLAIIILHFIANAVGLYKTEVVWFDNVLHALAGFAFGLLWLRMREKSSAVSVLAFVLAVALSWELLEFLFLTFFTKYAHSTGIYSLSVEEAAADTLSNLVGGFALVLWGRKDKVIKSLN